MQVALLPDTLAAALPTTMQDAVLQTMALIATLAAGVINFVINLTTVVVISAQVNLKKILLIKFKISSPAPVSCSSLSVPSGTTGGLTVSVPSTSVNSVATYSCTLSGYNLIGQSQRTCQSSGSWSGSQPYCQSESNHYSLQCIP